MRQAVFRALCFERLLADAEVADLCEILPRDLRPDAQVIASEMRQLKRGLAELAPRPRDGR